MKRSIKRDFQVLSIVTIAISMFVLSGFWIFYDYKSFQLESERLRTKYMSEYEDSLRYQVHRVVTEVKYEQSLTDQKLRKDIKERTNEAWMSVKNIISQNAHTIDNITLKKIVKDSLRNIRFNNGSGFYFAINMNGTVELNPILPELEGQDIRTLRNDSGQFVAADILKIAQSSGEGFYQYNWRKPNQPEKEYPKIAFIKYIKELDWVIGTGEYLDDFTSELQKDMSQRIEQVRFGKEKGDYVFVATWDGIGKSFPATGKNMLEMRDANGVFVVKELIKKAKAGGGFVQYVMPMLGGVQSKPKLSYAAPIPEWKWYVGAGVYIDEIETEIARNQQMFKDKVRQHVGIMLMVLLILLIFHFTVSHLISRKIWKQIDLFSHFFRRASAVSELMESDMLNYREFHEISKLANVMLVERNAILEEIRLSRDEWVNTFNAIGDCIMLLDGKGNIERANETAILLHGIPEEKIINMPFSEFCGHDNPVSATLIDNLPHTAEIEHEKLNRTFLASSFPLFSSEGELYRIIHIAHDITEQKTLEKQLGQAQKMEAIGTLAGGIAHDFNNILGAILGYAEMVQEDCPTGSIMRSNIDRVVEASLRAKELVKQILAFSRQAESDKIVLQPALIIKEAMKMLRASLPKTIDIQQNIDPEAGLILADPTQIHQIITNLCTNAFHAMEEIGGTLKVSLKNKVLTPDDLVSEPHVKPGQFVEISVGDTGPGIVPGIMDKIFDPFFTTKEVGKGTGMGLATIHGIAKKSGGFVSCKSSLGKGTTFYVYLPVQAVTAPPEAETTLLELVQSGIEHILFIDDEEMLAAMGKTMLERLGYRVTVETNSIEALKIIQSQPDAFDLVITDQTMPGMTGSDLARRILQIRPGLPIILCTGFSNQISEEKARIYGIKGFAMKPLTKKDLAVLIRKALDGE